MFKLSETKAPTWAWKPLQTNRWKENNKQHQKECMPWDSQTKVLFFHFSQSPRVSPSKHKNTDRYKRKKQRQMQMPKQMWNINKQKLLLHLFQKFTFLGWTVNANLQHKFKIKTEAICHLSFHTTISLGSYLQMLHRILVSWVTRIRAKKH